MAAFFSSLLELLGGHGTYLQLNFESHYEPNNGKERVMVQRKKSAGKKSANKGRVKVGKLQLSKETVRDLTGSEEKRVRGGAKKMKTDATCLVIACSVGCI